VNPPKPIEPTPAHVPTPQPQSSTDKMKFHATAYSIEGRTASGAKAREGLVAGDPAVLPLGTRIRVGGAGAYDGEYVVKDTGRRIDGREIDIYLANDAEAKRFGNRTVTVEVLEYGKGKRGGK
jgi:3D (Asp-Asp-Asp) domain-containing protein